MLLVEGLEGDIRVSCGGGDVGGQLHAAAGGTTNTTSRRAGVGEGVGPEEVGAEVGEAAADFVSFSNRCMRHTVKAKRHTATVMNRMT